MRDSPQTEFRIALSGARDGDAPSLRQPDAAQQLDKARLGAQAVKVRVNADNQQMIGVLGIALIQQIVRAFLLSQTGVDASQVDRGDAPAPGSSLQLRKLLQSLVAPAGDPV